MRAFVFTIATLLATFFLFSCTMEIERETPPRLYHYEYYYVPTTIDVVDAGEGFFNIHLMSQTTVESPSQKFKELSEIYGEEGKKEIPRWIFRNGKPYNLRGISVFQSTDDGKMLDLSDQFFISISSAERYIKSNYDPDESIDDIVKKISDLTEYDLKWLPAYFQIYFDPTIDMRKVTLRVEVEPGYGITIPLVPFKTSISDYFMF